MAKKIKSPEVLIGDDKQEIFDEIIKMDNSGVIKESDAIVIGLLVDAIIEYRSSCIEIDENGIIITLSGDRGHEKQTVSPYVGMKKDARATILKICSEIGFSPKAAAALQLVEAEAEALSPFEKALKKRNNKNKR